MKLWNSGRELDIDSMPRGDRFLGVAYVLLVSMSGGVIAPGDRAIGIVRAEAW